MKFIKFFSCAFLLLLNMQVLFCMDLEEKPEEKNEISTSCIGIMSKNDELNVYNQSNENSIVKIFSKEEANKNMKLDLEKLKKLLVSIFYPENNYENCSVVTYEQFLSQNQGEGILSVFLDIPDSEPSSVLTLSAAIYKHGYFVYHKHIQEADLFKNLFDDLVL